MHPLSSRHFVSISSPARGSSTIDAHLAVLFDLAARHGGDAGDPLEIYVWWGGKRTSNGTPAPPDAISLDARKPLGDGETHLYLTDYRSLYVAHVTELSDDNILSSDRAHVPDCYLGEGNAPDFWLKLRDLRRIVGDDLLAVVEELKRLRHPENGAGPFSLHESPPHLPMRVTRSDDEPLFDEKQRIYLTDGRLWAEFDAEVGRGIGPLERELRENLFGDAAWLALDPAVRTLIAAAEKRFREHRDDPAYDFAVVLDCFTRALEAQCNFILRRAVRRATAAARHARVGSRIVDLLSFRPLSLREMARAIRSERDLEIALRTGLDNGVWFTASLPEIMADLVEVRGPRSRGTRLDRETVTRWRSQLVGIGCTGILVELAMTRPR
jgi:hypothetical protein